MAHHTEQLLKRLKDIHPQLTGKGKILNAYIQEHPKKVVFMTIKELAQATGVSEATVVRFVRTLGFSGYNDFLQELRDVLDTDSPMLERMHLSVPETDMGSRLHSVVAEGMQNLQHFYKQVDLDVLEQIIDRIEQSQDIFVIGSRLSYMPAYFLGWVLTKIRHGVNILKGSDSTSLDWLANAQEGSLIIIFSTTRYPNELIRLGRTVKRLNQTLIVIADSSLCPLLSFADLSLVTPSKNIPLFGDLTIFNTLIRFITLELANRSGSGFTQYQERLEQIYLENDTFFNLRSSND
ncbi:MurR/RpiR family transcriptional regulator [Desulfovermiculus halophilus]|jgi:DNA-binding MurR/RpiR family transcriptional regulator|uniref:MurR/RpiR family transcriptional regulator n=1 Tax=Desulfovermiculus halophilus TaxID=339722 RepID=UPI0006868D43|nr:MurR/RpiR family transcriptional regulator [Desulfovermiculus halophilus]